ncbi:unnamed protein product [marine sediment metagenome]|uniref:Saccharopine dehydrogenase-like C-terminal domain-containing protein n=1 Tax=marine sediment metagenome TaxID=412755 RepID=X1ITQ4_9ZZZZ
MKGVKVAPRDVLLKLVRHPVDTFFTEDENTCKLPIKIGISAALEITGTKSREYREYKITYTPSFFVTPEERLGIYRKFGATNIYVALPAIVGAKMCMEGNAGRGVIAAECLDPTKFLRMMAAMGSPVKFSEVCSKEMCVS